MVAVPRPGRCTCVGGFFVQSDVECLKHLFAPGDCNLNVPYSLKSFVADLIDTKPQFQGLGYLQHSDWRGRTDGVRAEVSTSALWQFPQDFP